MILVAGLAIQQAKSQPYAATNQQTVAQKKSATSTPFVLPPQLQTKDIQGNDRQNTANAAQKIEPNPIGLTDIIQAWSAVLSMLATVALAIFAAVQIVIYRSRLRLWLSIGTQKGPRIGVQKGPL